MLCFESTIPLWKREKEELKNKNSRLIERGGGGGLKFEGFGGVREGLYKRKALEEGGCPGCPAMNMPGFLFCAFSHSLFDWAARAAPAKILGALQLAGGLWPRRFGCQSLTARFERLD